MPLTVLALVDAAVDQHVIIYDPVIHQTERGCLVSYYDPLQAFGAVAKVVTEARQKLEEAIPTVYFLQANHITVPLSDCLLLP